MHRPDRIKTAAHNFVVEMLGQQYVEPPQESLGEALADSGPTQPLIIVLSPGVDPNAALGKLALEKGMADRLRTVALGQGQVH